MKATRHNGRSGKHGSYKGPTNYYNKTLDETTYTYDEGESF